MFLTTVIDAVSLLPRKLVTSTLTSNEASAIATTFAELSENVARFLQHQDCESI